MSAVYTCEQLTVIRLVMRDTIEQELYERNNKRNIAEVSLNFTSSSSNQLGVQVSHSPWIIIVIFTIVTFCVSRRFSLSIQSQEIGLGNVSEMTYFGVEWDIKP